MTPALDYEECRRRLCCTCGVKLSSPSMMSAADEDLVRKYSPYPGYSREVKSSPVALCPTCQRSLYKRRSGNIPKGWGGDEPPAWSRFSLDSIYGARTCGSLDSEGKLRMCDLCTHVRSNPIGSILPKSIATKPVLQIRGKEEAIPPKEESPVQVWSLPGGEAVWNSSPLHANGKELEGEGAAAADLGHL